MGQQQLLLVILVTIIVGIATVVAINTFSSAAASANLDAVRQDVAAFTSGAHGYAMKPTMFGGGNNTFTGLEFGKMTFQANHSEDGLSAVNENGTYVITDVQPTQVTLRAYPAAQDGYVADPPEGPYFEIVIRFASTGTPITYANNGALIDS